MPVLSAHCFFFIFSRVPSHISHTARAQFSSHVRVISSSSMSPWIPSGGRQMEQRPLVMCSAVWSAPQSQQSLVDSPHRSMFAPNLPTPVRSLFSRVQTRRDRPTPCPLFDGVGHVYTCAVSLWWMPTTQPTLFVSSVSPSLVEGQRTLVGEYGE